MKRSQSEKKSVQRALPDYDSFRCGVDRLAGVRTFVQSLPSVMYGYARVEASFSWVDLVVDMSPEGMYAWLPDMEERG